MNNIKQTSISIIIPSLNSEKYIQETLNSVINQSLENIEILCIDNGSTDKTKEIISSYQKKDPRILFYNEKKVGACHARNLGIKLANGDFITFLDSDDLYPNKHTLKKLYETATSTNVNICGGSLYLIDENGKPLKKNKQDSNFIFDSNKIIRYNDYQFDYGFTRFIYKRSFILENNLFFPNYLREEDPVFFVKAMIKASNFYSLSECTYLYRKNHKTVTWNQNSIEDTLRSYQTLLTISKNHNLIKLHHKISKRVTGKGFLKIIHKNNSKVKIIFIDTITLIDFKSLRSKKIPIKIKNQLLLLLSDIKKKHNISSIISNLSRFEKIKFLLIDFFNKHYN